MSQSDTTVPPKVLAQLFQLTQRRIQQLAKDEIIPKAQRGNYPLLASVKGYISFLQDSSRKANNDNDALMQARLRFENARAEMAEIELEEKKDALVKADDIQDMLTVTMSNFTARMNALPSAIATQGTELSQLELEQLARNKVNEALHELSQYDSQQAESR